ncbi:MAG: hypothetical protein KGL40_07595 [Rhodocyclaceae bacterium]|nr:hypothetical protein [Rhodocyclaceae bacterium]
MMEVEGRKAKVTLVVHGVMKARLIPAFVIAGAFAVSLGATYYFFWIWNPMISDEEMIADFQAHRADFEELVKRYREYPRSPDKDTSLWFKDGDTLEVYKRAGIGYIDYSALHPWLPNPYSVETGRLVDRLVKTAKSFDLFFKYGMLQLTPEAKPIAWLRDRHRLNTLVYAVVWKDYYFVPEVPKVEYGELLGPADSRGEYSFRARVLPSLNHFPSHWKDFECVYRQIEPQWFIRMCNGH